MKYLIFLSTKRSNAKGHAPIYFRIKLPGQTLERSTGIYINPMLFDRINKRVIGKSKEHLAYNNLLNTICAQLDDLLQNDSIPFVATIEKIFGGSKGTNEPNSFVHIMEAYLVYMQDRVSNHQSDSIKPVTYSKNIFMKESINRYLRETNSERILGYQVDRTWVKQFMDVCLKDKGYSKGHTNRLVKFVKSVLRFAVSEGICQVTSALMVKVKQENKPIQFLNENELMQLEKFKFIDLRLDRVRDAFLFLCYTGLSYIDLKVFDSKQVYTDAFGNYFIKYYRVKNGNEAIVPMLPEALTLLKKYNGHIPVISNQKFNDYLKLVGISIGLEYPLTSHVGRKTCGSILLNKGLSIFTVKTILGHSSVKTTESYYARLTEVGIINEMQNLQGLYVANAKQVEQLKMFG